MVIYPEEYSHEYHGENYDDFTAEPLTKGIEKIQKFGKEIGNIFKQSE
jgi:hypothetical protein